MISRDDLLQILGYSPESGEFVWMADRGAVRCGDKAGSLRKDGYLQLWVNNRALLAHRVAWLFVTGDWPDVQVDHIDRNRSNNRFSNLRLATNKQNGENLPILVTNTSGHRGVTWDKNRNLWLAQLKHYGRNIYLGRYSSVNEAAEAAKNARARLFSHSNE